MQISEANGSILGANLQFFMLGLPLTREYHRQVGSALIKHATALLCLSKALLPQSGPKVRIIEHHSQKRLNVVLPSEDPRVSNEAAKRWQAAPFD